MGSISEKPTKPEREIFWQQVLANLEQHNLSDADRSKVSAAIAKIVPRGSSKHEKFISAKSDEHNTPGYFLDAVVGCLGAIDLDPCSNSRDNPNVPAGKHLTIEDNGLIHDWKGRVFINPPFSKVKGFLEKLIAEMESGRVSEAIMLTKNDTRTHWFGLLRKNAQALCFVEGYHKFGSAENSATFGVLLSYFGNNPGRFCDVFGQFGVCTSLSVER